MMQDLIMVLVLAEVCNPTGVQGEGGLRSPSAAAGQQVQEQGGSGQRESLGSLSLNGLGDGVEPSLRS
jgi:hypothetical protein